MSLWKVTSSYLWTFLLWCVSFENEEGIKTSSWHDQCTVTEQSGHCLYKCVTMSCNRCNVHSSPRASADNKVNNNFTLTLIALIPLHRHRQHVQNVMVRTHVFVWAWAGGPLCIHGYTQVRVDWCSNMWRLATQQYLPFTLHNII